ncbi:Mur ligase family protein [Bifidobacterium choloepi]|uniref:Lipid II isoglutaminyl synthase (glutamine-hydrolyzing) subunit MurT n=1 Tax=Bifidobacterium choloepi TaxID=2614131 RepID=A0A6I5N043_9BIFI|nr:Mur ligase family protein [Bifidobacterium choloepi]NEG69856.1 DUF1727 domain-containing protein [Bifidobacterium choloepi]
MFATPLIGKAVRVASRLTHHGGSAFPGKVVERIDPGFLRRTLGRLPLGVVLVSGTNGKTTTTRMVATMLEELGLKVFTNPTGSNFTRGVVSSVLEQCSLAGHVDADIAVLELDEAYAVHFVKQAKPRYALLLNVMRDQLDRFGEIDNTARLLAHVAAATTGTVVLNREDPRIAALEADVHDGVDVKWFGLSDKLRPFFPSDDEMATTVASQAAAADRAAGETSVLANSEEAGSAPELVNDSSVDMVPADVTLLDVGDHRVTLDIDGETETTAVRLEGVYNLFNAAAALTVVRAVQHDVYDAAVVRKASGRLPRRRVAAFIERARKLAKATVADELKALSTVTPAFGRGETIDVDGTPVELLLVKNPMGFRLSLASFPPDGAETMICINDEYADGRDMSWLWDVDFTSLRDTGVAAVSGVRAYDMKLRLEYDQVAVARAGTELEDDVVMFVKSNPGVPKHIYCTYTAMLRARAALGRIASVSDAGVGK